MNLSIDQFSPYGSLDAIRKTHQYLKYSMESIDVELTKVKILGDKVKRFESIKNQVESALEHHETFTPSSVKLITQSVNSVYLDLGIKNKFNWANESLDARYNQYEFPNKVSQDLTVATEGMTDLMGKIIDKVHNALSKAIGDKKALFKQYASQCDKFLNKIKSSNEDSVHFSSKDYPNLYLDGKYDPVGVLNNLADMIDKQLVQGAWLQAESILYSSLQRKIEEKFKYTSTLGDIREWITEARQEAEKRTEFKTVISDTVSFNRTYTEKTDDVLFNQEVEVIKSSRHETVEVSKTTMVKALERLKEISIKASGIDVNSQVDTFLKENDLGLVGDMPKLNPYELQKSMMEKTDNGPVKGIKKWVSLIAIFLLKFDRLIHKVRLWALPVMHLVNFLLFNVVNIGGLLLSMFISWSIIKLSDFSIKFIEDYLKGNQKVTIEKSEIEQYMNKHQNEQANEIKKELDSMLSNGIKTMNVLTEEVGADLLGIASQWK